MVFEWLLGATPVTIQPLPTVSLVSFKFFLLLFSFIICGASYGLNHLWVKYGALVHTSNKKKAIPVIKHTTEVSRASTNVKTLDRNSYLSRAYKATGDVWNRYRNSQPKNDKLSEKIDQIQKTKLVAGLSPSSRPVVRAPYTCHKDTNEAETPQSALRTLLTPFCSIKESIKQQFKPSSQSSTKKGARKSDIPNFIKTPTQKMKSAFTCHRQTVGNKFENLKVKSENGFKALDEAGDVYGRKLFHNSSWNRRTTCAPHGDSSLSDDFSSGSIDPAISLLNYKNMEKFRATNCDKFRPKVSHQTDTNCQLLKSSPQISASRRQIGDDFLPLRRNTQESMTNGSSMKRRDEGENLAKSRKSAVITRSRPYMCHGNTNKSTACFFPKYSEEKESSVTQLKRLARGNLYKSKTEKTWTHAQQAETQANVTKPLNVSRLPR